MDAILAQLIAQLTPMLAEIAVTTVVTLIGALYFRLTSTRIDADARERLHSALETGAAVVLNREMTETQKIEALIEYAEASVPAAIKRLKPTISVLQTLALSKIEKTLTGQ